MEALKASAWNQARGSEPPAPLPPETVEVLTSLLPKPSQRSDDSDSWYLVVSWIIGFVSFAIAWVYAILTYGFFLGVGLGWIPALAIGFVCGLLWPIAVIVIAVVAWFVLRGS